MSVGWTVYLLLVSLVASTVGGMLGMAGGILVVPILTVSGVDIRTAIAASIVSVIASSCASAAPYLRRGLTNVRLALVLELATTTGAVTGVLLTGLVPTRFLFALFAAILVLSAWQMVQKRAGATDLGEAIDAREWGSVLSLHSSYREDGASTETPYFVRRLPIAMTLMYGAGLVSALLGIGSGVLKIPAMDTALRLPLKVSSATSSFMIGVTAAASAGAYFVRGDIVPAIAGPVALGSVVGAIVGARVLFVVSTKRLRGFFVGVLVLLAVQMALAAFGVTIGAHS
ncbi:MAG TPA: sulfite exporter TauE/SafE family protein [Polyangiaceae bacterium]